MKNIFNVSDEEKNRIKNLHLVESEDERITSVLNEQDEKVDIRVDEPVMGDDMVKTDISVMDKQIEPLDDVGPEKSVLPAHYHVFIWCRTGQQKVMIASPYGGLNPSGGGTDLQTLSQIFYSSVGSPAPGQTVHIGNASGGGGTPREDFCLTYVGFEIRTQYLDTNVLAMTTTNVDGIFTDCQDCIQGGAVGSPEGYCVDCVQGVMTTYPNAQNPTATSCPPGFADLGPTNPQNGPCVKCNQALGCQSVGWGFGPNHFNSMSECQQSNCSPALPFECVTNPTNPNISVCTPQAGGQYSSFAACQAVCSSTSNSYDCVDWTSPNGCQSVTGSGGQFPTLDDCLVSPCQCDATILAWPFYQNNPNNPQGNWDGVPHDGPSNPNALSQILSNVQNSPAYTSSNTSQLQKAKCREAAIFHWQANSTNVACCSDQNWAIGAATSDPLGCVGQNYINLINNNFIPNSPNWNNQGCTWLQNALNTTMTNQAQYPSSSTAYCKLQGKITFLQNLMQTGQSSYINGSVSFTPPC